MSRLSMTAALLLAGAGAARGQSLDRSKRPVPPPPVPFVSPKVDTFTLANGLRLAIVEDHALPVVAVRVVLPVDSAADPVGKEGLFDVTLGMLREGTVSTSADQLAAAIASLGSDVSATRFTTVTDNLPRSLELMADMLMHPSFPPDAVERRKAARATAVQRGLQVPSTVARRIFYGKLFGATHSIARAVAPPEASVKSIGRDDVVGFYDKYFQPQNVTLVIAGDVRAADALKLVTRALGAWKNRGERYVATFDPPAPATPTTIYLYDRPGTPQSVVFAGQFGPTRTTSDLYAIEALGPILGSSSESRLLQNLRNRHSYMYSGAPFAVVWRPALPANVLTRVVRRTRNT